MNLLERVKELAGGAKTLADWIGEGGHVVSQDHAQLRANVCLRCPMNSSKFSLTEAVAIAVKQQMEVKNHLQMKVSGERSLHVCLGCGCALRLKIWLPIESILPSDDERAKFWEQCWILREAQ